jgi:Tol biopolymer transport system component
LRDRFLRCSVLATLVFVLICARASGPHAAEAVHEVALTKGTSDSSPRISPDGKQIVFAREERQYLDFGRDLMLASNIWTVTAVGTNQQKLTHFDLLEDFPGGARDPSWSPDGKSIVFSAYKTLNDGGIFIMDIATGTLKQITASLDDRDPDWSPDGRHIAYTANGRRLSVMDIDGRNSHPLTTGDLGEGIEYSPRWSPQGDRIAYLNQQTVYLIGANGENPRPLKAFAFGLTWSKDGRFVYFESAGTVEKIAADGSAPPEKVFDWGYENEIDLSPDGKWFAADYACEDGGCPAEGKIYKLMFP